MVCYFMYSVVGKTLREAANKGRVQCTVCIAAGTFLPRPSPGSLGGGLSGASQSVIMLFRMFLRAAAK